MALTLKRCSPTSFDPSASSRSRAAWSGCKENTILELDWHGYELHPDTPSGGIELAKKFGGKERVAAMQARLLEFAKSFGITDMKFRDRSPNTRRALRCPSTRAIREIGSFRHLAMDAHWRRGMDLEADLRKLASESGLDPDAALAASRSDEYLSRIDRKRAEAEEAGVTGIPTFVIGDQGVAGCQRYEVLAQFVESEGARKRGAA